jgi:hypothetical protein
MHNSLRIIADSTFFLVFLYDIDRPSCLKKIADEFDFSVTHKVCTEVRDKLADYGKQTNYALMVSHPRISFVSLEEFDPTEVLEPFFNENEKQYGQHSVFAYCYVLHDENIRDFCIIVDTWHAMRWLRENMNHLCCMTKWTSDFIGDCCCSLNILSKNEANDIIDDMKRENSLRIPVTEARNVKERIKSC